MTRRELVGELAAVGAVGAVAAAGMTGRVAAGPAAVAAAATEGARFAGPGDGTPSSAAQSVPLSQRVDAWRKIFASLRDDEEVCCWYFGTMLLQVQGMPEIPVVHAETIMVYRASTAADGATRMRWIEVGRFRDPLTGGPAQTWLNPFSGRRVPTPKSFITRPGVYHVRSAPGALAIRLEQDDARVERVDVRLSEQGPRVWLQQEERKTRGVPAGATAAQLAGRAGSVTRLALAADRREVDDTACMNAAASGSYSFETAALPAWAGIDLPGSTVVRGVIQKAGTDVVVNAQSWRELRALYPQFFAGEKVAPRWE